MAPARVALPRSPGRVTRSRGVLLGVALLAVSALMAGMPLPQSRAVTPGRLPAEADAAAIRLFQGGQYAGSGTLVDRNWALTVAHVIRQPDNPNVYTLRFGVVDNARDGHDDSNLRVIDRIVPHPQLADIAMVHFRDPVPQDTWIPPLATTAPRRFSAARLYGWGATGQDLTRAVGLVFDPVAAENAARWRSQDPRFASTFPGDIQPMAVNLGGAVVAGDSGGGVYSGGTLIGVHCCRGGYRYANESGAPSGREFKVTYDQPVWQHRDWILKTISGEGTSGDPHDELKRRRLEDDETVGDTPMTLPPQGNACDPGPSCTTPDPVWSVATLAGVQGAVAVGCAADSPGDCAFGESTYAVGTSTTLALGTRGGTGAREVLVWCVAQQVGSAAPKFTISFTNADAPGQPLGRGWWLTTQDFLTTRITTAPAC
jgi:Trypsin